jgi:hypothetical protein
MKMRQLSSEEKKIAYINVKTSIKDCISNIVQKEPNRHERVSTYKELVHKE